jgi:hypothetical protein
MNLQELIMKIPAFIEHVVALQHQSKSNSSDAPKMIGKFYLGLNYDY